MTITNYLNSIKQSKANATLQSTLYVLEAKYSVRQLEKILAITNTQEQSAQIVIFLNQRWERIRGTDLAYVHAPNHDMTQLCLALANQIAPPLGKNPLQLLMPTLKNTVNPITHLSLDDYQLQDILLNDSDTEVFDIITTIEHQDKFALTESECHRLITHSVESLSLHDALQELQHVDSHGSIGGAIEFCLLPRLNHSHVNGGRDGKEHVAGLDADIGRIQFQTYLNTLTRSERRKIFACRVHPDENVFFGHLWDRLTYRKFDKKTTEHIDSMKLDSIYCVEMITPDLNLLLQNNPHLFNKKSSNHREFLQKLLSNKTLSILNLQNKLKEPNLEVKSTYGNSGQAKLAANLLHTDILATLSEEDIASHRAHLQSLDKIALGKQFEALPEACRLHFIKLMGANTFQSRFCAHGYDLAKILRLLNESNRLDFLISLELSSLQKSIEDNYQFAEVIQTLTTVKAAAFFSMLDDSFIKKIFSTRYTLKVLFAEKLALEDWDKMTVLLRSEVLSKQVQEWITKDLSQMAAKHRFKLVEMVGIERVLSYFPQPDALKKFLGLFSREEQEVLHDQIDFKMLFLSQPIKSAKELKSSIKLALDSVDDFCLSPASQKRFAKQALTFYSIERGKQTRFSFFSSKTKAIDALQNVAENKADPAILKPHKRHMDNTKVLGAIYRRLGAN